MYLQMCPTTWKPDPLEYEAKIGAATLGIPNALLISRLVLGDKKMFSIPLEFWYEIRECSREGTFHDVLRTFD